MQKLQKFLTEKTWPVNYNFFQIYFDKQTRKQCLAEYMFQYVWNMPSYYGSALHEQRNIS